MRLVVTDAAISFHGVAIFSGLNGTFESGAVTALVGPSGSGKSSLLAAIGGFQSLSSGRIELFREDGSAPSAPSPDAIAWVPQGSNALSRRTALDNVLVAALAGGHSLREATELARDALDQVGLSHRLSEQARRLSGGELQRVAIARALASGKDLVLADEPSANLDARNTEEVAALLERLVTRATVIVATHDPLLIDAAHAVVPMRGVVPSDA